VLSLFCALGVTRFADFLLSLGYDRTLIRKLFNSIAIFCPAVSLVLAAYSGCNTIMTVLWLCLAVGFNGCQYAGFLCCHLDLAPAYAGTLLGITNAAANITGFVAPFITGLLTDGHNDLAHWRTVFFLAAIVYSVGGTIFLIWGSAKEQAWGRGLLGDQQEDEEVLEQDDY